MEDRPDVHVMENDVLLEIESIKGKMTEACTQTELKGDKAAREPCISFRDRERATGHAVYTDKQLTSSQNHACASKQVLRVFSTVLQVSLKFQDFPHLSSHDCCTDAPRIACY